MVTSFSLVLLASHYYATDLTVVNSLGTTFQLTNVLLDTTRSLLYLQNCGHTGGCIVNEGTISRCPVGWKQKVRRRTLARDFHTKDDVFSYAHSCCLPM